MTDYADANARSRRLALLRVLAENEGSANESVIKVALAALGFRGRLATDDAVRSDLDMLKEAGLIVDEWYQGRVRIATLTKRGVSFLARQVDPVSGIEYPSMGV
ncbi:ArsR family transcriptional regulator [Oleomonas cavernae]|uniref:ArsR family transcriptional regulator n=1 Tax=Oleomonas cavernae TaxID=2320859 RepID=A0A418WUG1_9PROT|nr:ArsR family transcriptional regulator [Oleomonas cavernae]RJF94816.1 ArsR family transcriptional regulator [Oleomonas cavernae]